MSSDRDEPRGLIFNVQKFSLQDGPGIRTTFFMKGCPLRCPWCSNPEGMHPAPEIMTIDSRCIGCGACVEVCAAGAISLAGGTRAIDRERCDGCLACAGRCPSGALEVSGVHMTVDEAFAIAARDEPFYRASGGGVTVSGGEPMLQWTFVSALLARCRRVGYHTAVDTSGFCEWESLERVLAYTDLLLFDVKSPDARRHAERTGRSNDLILANLERAAGRARVWLRMPLVPGFNDTERDVRKTAELAVRVNAERVSLLPYHDWARAKYARLGKPYAFEGVEPLREDGDAVVRCRDILESYGLAVRTGS